jgi:uncharacterized protein
MSLKLPDEVMHAWSNREGPLVLTTVDKNGFPNAIYASAVNLTSDGRIAVVDNYFTKTKSNIDYSCKVAVLFISKERKAYQLKGRIDYFDSGLIFNEMLSWADSKHPRKGVVVLNAEEIFKGKEKLA